ncbi:hypothetical protein GQ457_14G015100 [Hibiscus cannabinus]
MYSFVFGSSLAGASAISFPLFSFLEGINHTRIFSNIPKGSAYQREGKNKVKVKDLKPKRIKDYLECKISQRKKPSFTTSRYVLNLPPGKD